MDLKEQYEKLLRYCIMLTKNRTLAEDIVQETYLRFWASHSYRDAGKELAYLYTIARNLCMDEFRRPRAEPLEEYGEQLPDEAAQPETRLDSLALHQALEALPQSLREPVLLRYMNGMAVGDIARILGISRFTVHRRIKEGLTLLKQTLGGEPDER